MVESEYQRYRKIARNWAVGYILALLSIPLFTFGFFEARKAYWNYKVEQLCEVDGGVRINENINIGKEEYQLYLNEFGNFTIPREHQASQLHNLFSRDQITYLRRNNPKVRRFELQVIRRSDNKVLGKQVTYSRTGGSLFAFHPTVFRCPESLENLFAAVVSHK